MHVEQRAQETPLFVVLLEHLLRETALLSRKVQQLLVVELASKLLRKDPRDFSSARTELSSDVYNYLFLHISFISSYREVKAPTNPPSIGEV